MNHHNPYHLYVKVVVSQQVHLSSGASSKIVMSIPLVEGYPEGRCGSQDATCLKQMGIILPLLYHFCFELSSSPLFCLSNCSLLFLYHFCFELSSTPPLTFCFGFRNQHTCTLSPSDTPNGLTYSILDTTTNTASGRVSINISSHVLIEAKWKQQEKQNFWQGG